MDGKDATKTIKTMKPYHAIPIIAAVCLAGTAYAAFENNSKAGVAADLQLLATATKNEKRQDAEKDRIHFLDAIAKEVIAGKVADVLFDDRGVLQRSNLPKIIKTNQYFSTGKEVPRTLVLSSVGIRNTKTGEYAAIAFLEGRLQIIQVYSSKEVQNTISQQGAKS